MSSFTTKLIVDGAITVLLVAYAMYLWRLRNNKAELEARLKKSKADPKVHDTYKKLHSREFIKVILLLATSSALSAIEDTAGMILGHIPPLLEFMVAVLGMITLFWALYLGYTLFKGKSTK